MLELIKKPNIDFIGKKYITLIVTGTLSIIGIIAIVQIATGRANMGIDFAGGTEIQLKFEKPVALQSVRSALETGGVKGFELQDIPAENRVMIKTKQSEVIFRKYLIRSPLCWTKTCSVINMSLIPQPQ